MSVASGEGHISFSAEDMKVMDSNSIQHVEGLNILLVEDSYYNQKLALGMLGKHHHMITVANHGREALEKFPEDEFDIVLMDLQMPEMDGFEASRAIRELEKETGNRIPIVAMSAEVMKGVRERCIEAGMDDYLVKPVRAKQVYETISKFFPDRISFKDPKTAYLHSSSFDWSLALKAAGGDEELLRDVIDAFLEEYPSLIQGMVNSLNNNDSREFARFSHTLKGAMRTFGYFEAEEVAERLERLGEENELNSVGNQIEDIEEKVSRFLVIAKELLQTDYDPGT